MIVAVIYAALELVSIRAMEDWKYAREYGYFTMQTRSSHLWNEILYIEAREIYIKFSYMGIF